MKKGTTHGQKSLSKGLRPELRTLCGAFDEGKSKVRYPDRIVDQIFNEQRAQIDCCLRMI